MKASLVATLALAAAFTFATGCSSSSDTGTTDSGTTSDTGSGGGDTAVNPETGGDAGPVPLDCASYCAQNLSICKDQQLQYNDLATCTAICPKFPPGKTTDTSGDTFGCRAYHTAAAEGLVPPGSSPDPTTHCTHSGPFGGNVCGDSRCADWCELALAQCGTVAGTPFNDKASCMTVCSAAQPLDPALPELSPSAAGKMNCLEYHLEAAFIDPATHCKHLTTAKAAASPCASP